MQLSPNSGWGCLNKLGVAKFGVWHGRVGFQVPPARLAEWHAAALVDQAALGPTERHALDLACLLLPGARGHLCRGALL